VRILFSALALLLLPMLCGAQMKLTLSQAIATALKSHPRLEESRAAVESMQGRTLQAKARPNPRLQLQSENSRFWGVNTLPYWRETDTFAYVSQVFETASKRQRRVDQAAAGVDLSQIDQRGVERQIAGRVTAAYWSAAAAVALRNLLRQDVERFEEIVQLHRDRVREGVSAEIDLMRVLLERDRLLINFSSAEQEVSHLLILLQREIGRPNIGAAIELADELTNIADFPTAELASSTGLRLEVQAARQNVALARTGLDLQRSRAHVDPDVLFGYKRTLGFNTLIAGVNIPLPFSDRNKGNIEAAAAEIRMAQARLAEVDVQVRSEVELARAAYEAKRKLITDTLTPMRNRAEEVARIALEAYKVGGLDLLRLLDAQRAQIDSMTAYFRALSDYQQSVVALRLALGVPL
jgi:cobalt-zinc-cadmium efflux system outer membrane protein